MAALNNVSASDIDKTSFWWTGLCAICHVGGGASEFDQGGNKYYDVATSTWGNPNGGTAAVELDGDYGEVSNQDGSSRPAPWDETGVLEPDCLYCHRSDRHYDMAAGMNFDWIFRAGVLRGKDALTDTALNPVPAFAAAPTAAQGWGTVGLAQGVAPPKANTFDIDYQKGVTDGSLYEDGDGNLRVTGAQISDSPKDMACWGCHVIADDKKRGRVWFDPHEDVHYARFNGVTDQSSQAALDAAVANSAACSACHPSTSTPEFPYQSKLNPGEHNFAKGNANLGTAREDTDYYLFNNCADCHDGTTAPAPQSLIHTQDHLDAMSCDFCHIPLKRDNASLAIDNAVTGKTINYNTDEFLTTDPLDPTQGTTDWWYPSAMTKLHPKLAGDDRLFPVKLLLSCWVGDWDTQTDVIAPVILWRLRGLTMGAPLAGVVDDNGDGKPEVNTPDEILMYLIALRDNVDVYGNPIAANPVYVKGGEVYYLNGDLMDVFPIHGSGIKVESEHPFSISHNVLPLDQGVTLGKSGCNECHGGVDTPVFDRLILVNPFDEQQESAPGVGDGAQPVYKTLREITGVDPN